MKHSDFSIGMSFFTSMGDEYMCTDVGTRTIAAVWKSDPKVLQDPSWLKGPPYAVAEHVFDEDAIETVCLTREESQEKYRW